jgi:hypothetical protein
LAFHIRKKTITHSFAKSEIDEGTYLTRFQTALKLGLAAFPNPCPERDEIFRQTDSHLERCTEWGGKFIAYNTNLKAGVFLFMDRLIKTECKKTWEMVAENSTQVNIWEERAKECRARRNMALAHGVHMDTVRLEDVTSSEQGLEGWACVKVGVDVTGGGAQGKARAKAKPKAKAGAAQGSTTKNINGLEKRLKEALAQEMYINNETEELKEQRTADPDRWIWAGNFFDQCEAEKDKVGEAKGLDFYKKFAAAALSPEAMKRLRKECADNYHTELVRSVDKVTEPLATWGDIVGKVKTMADAANQGATTPAGTTGKRKVATPQGPPKAKQRRK